MFNASVDASALASRLTEIERRKFPQVLAKTLTQASYETRQAWMREIPRVFDRPVPLTMKAVLYKQAKPDRLFAEVFLRNEASNGTPPSKYLAPEVLGGSRRARSTERRLRERGPNGPVLKGNEFLIPARGYPTNAYGNIPATVYNVVLADLQAKSDPVDNSTRESRGRRSRRKQIGKRAVYFYNAQQRGKLPRGIYERTRYAAAGITGNAIRGVFMITNKATYDPPRLQVFDVAKQIFPREFAERWAINAIIAWGRDV